MPFRNYLMEFVVPTLNEGLLEVSNIIPNDPVDLLAEYLYQKSYDFWLLNYYWFLFIKFQIVVIVNLVVYWLFQKYLVCVVVVIKQGRVG